MAILIEGKTVCRLCNQPIRFKADAVGIPSMPLQTGLDALGDSVVHRACLMRHPQKASLVLSWKSYWQRIAAKSDDQALAFEHGMQFKIKRRLVAVLFDSFIEIEERAEDFDALNRFFALTDVGVHGQISLGWNRYEVLWSGNSVQLQITKIPTSMSPILGREIDQSMDVCLRLELSLAEWNAFKSIWVSPIVESVQDGV